jgi:hypothetical protein
VSGFRDSAEVAFDAFTGSGPVDLAVFDVRGRRWRRGIISIKEARRSPRPGRNGCWRTPGSTGCLLRAPRRAGAHAVKVVPSR